MCTLIVRHKIDRGCSTVIAANRDEFYHRPWSMPMVLHEEPRIIGGRDDRCGGTWLGFTEYGFFVGLTNHYNPTSYKPSLRSRGELVVGALAQKTLSGVREYLGSIEASAYNEFNMLLGDGEEVLVVYSRHCPAKVEIHTLGAGIYVLCNDRMNAPSNPKFFRVKHLANQIPSNSWPTLKEALIQVLSDRETDYDVEKNLVSSEILSLKKSVRYRMPICIHGDGYGTVSSTLAAVGSGRLLHYEFAPGPPDETPFEDQIPLLSRMRFDCARASM